MPNVGTDSLFCSRRVDKEFLKSGGFCLHTAKESGNPYKVLELRRTDSSDSKQMSRGMRTNVNKSDQQRSREHWPYKTTYV
jgi:hypothetical protein